MSLRRAPFRERVYNSVVQMDLASCNQLNKGKTDAETRPHKPMTGHLSSSDKTGLYIYAFNGTKERPTNLTIAHATETISQPHGLELIHHVT